MRRRVCVSAATPLVNVLSSLRLSMSHSRPLREAAARLLSAESRAE